MKPNKYWLKRQAETASALTTKSINETNVQRTKYYRDAMRRIISDFEKTYNKVITAFGQDKQVTPADLYKLDRYWKMQAEMREELKKLGDKESALLSEKFERHWKDIYESAELPSEENFVKYSSRNAAEMINEVWCADGKNWSQRVWHNVDKLQEALNSSLLDCVISGKTTKELKQKLQKDFGVSYNRAKSIVNTEMAHIQTQSAAQRYKDSGVEYYEFLADTDKSTCDICAALDGKRFKLIEMKPGENAPPMHPNDRCCIIPVIEKKEEDLTLPKNSGNIKVPEEKIYIGQSVGAMAKNFPVKDPDSRQHYKFAEGTVISKVKVIMGDGTNKPLSEKYKIALRNGIKNPNLIKKFRGEGFVIANGIIKKAELHWYEAENKKFEFKIKRYFK